MIEQPKSERRVVEVPRIDAPEVILEELHTSIQKRSQDPELPTGINPLDEIILGFHKKQVSVIAARPGEGKSSLAAFSAFHLAQKGKNVVYLTLEMARVDIVERLLCNFCDIDGEQLRRGILPTDFESRYTLFKKEFAKTNFRVLEGFGYELAEVQELVKLCGKKKPDVIFIDHIQRINPQGYMQRRDALIDYINGLERLALKENIAVVAVSQLNRDSVKAGKNLKPSLEHLRESGAIEETAATVLLLWWKTMDRDKDPNDTAFKIIVGKQRHGPSGMEINLDFYANKSRFDWTRAEIFRDITGGDEPRDKL